MTELILASSSPARLQTLRAAGLDPQVLVSDVDESSFSAADVIGLVRILAKAKAEAVDARLDAPADALIVACDSLLEMEDEPMGKPATAQEAIQRWHWMRGRTGRLHTGHQVLRRRGHQVEVASAVATTEVIFANISDAEIEAYVATGEPLRVAGAFTIDGMGGAFVTAVCGDPHNVVGISLPLLRRLFTELGVSWTDLWRKPDRTPAAAK